MWRKRRAIIALFRSPSPYLLPSYLWILENTLKPLIEQLKELSEEQSVIFLDYETNENVEDLSHPLSHAGLVKRYLENNETLTGAIR